MELAVPAPISAEQAARVRELAGGGLRAGRLLRPGPL